MARANPESSFESAARHLFRHINDAQALRNNPLLRSLFHALADETESTTLQRIHETVLVAARKSAERRAALSETRVGAKTRLFEHSARVSPPKKPQLDSAFRSIITIVSDARSATPCHGRFSNRHHTNQDTSRLLIPYDYSSRMRQRCATKA